MRTLGQTQKKAATINWVVNSGLLGKILRHLTNPADMVACSAVSRQWQAASRVTQPHCMYISDSPSMPKIGQAECLGILQWLQVETARGKFTSLTKLSVETDMMDLPQDMILVFFAPLCTMAQAWPLQDVHLLGWFEFDATVVLLPASLRHLVLPTPSQKQLSWLHLPNLRCSRRSLSTRMTPIQQSNQPIVSCYKIHTLV